uniref:Zinc finger protein RFP-like n=1 Tax=Podarcis muralis TaxID=64176 RepID=A0A670HY01_PODMU
MAASGGAVQDLCEEATCSICLECFRDPVIIPECGHNFCRACLIQCWEKSEGEASCPLCREIIQHRTLIPNRPLANVVEILGAEKVSLPGGKGAEGKGRVCEKHQEPLKLFCKEEEAPICVVCHVSKEHKGHEVIPLEEALQEYKVGNLSGFPLGMVRVKELQRRGSCAAHRLPEVHLQETAFRDLRIQTVPVYHLRSQLFTSTIFPSLPGPRRSTGRTDEMTICAFNCFNFLPRASFDTYGYVLGCEGFTTGRHFWEVIVGREEGWGVGVARKSVKRKGKFCFDTREGIWGLGKWGGGYELSSPHEFPHPSEEPKRIRVTLNFEGGRVSFYDADTAALLRAFPAASFSGETLQPLFYVPPLL